VPLSKHLPSLSAPPGSARKNPLFFYFSFPLVSTPPLRSRASPPNQAPLSSPTSSPIRRPVAHPYPFPPPQRAFRLPSDFFLFESLHILFFFGFPLRRLKRRPPRPLASLNSFPSLSACFFSPVFVPCRRRCTLMAVRVGTPFHRSTRPNHASLEELSTDRCFSR